MKQKVLFILSFTLFFKVAVAQQYQFAKQMGGIGFENAMGIQSDYSGNIYVAGYFADTADFDPGAGVFNLTSKGADDIFLAKYDSLGNLIWAEQIGGPGYDNIFSTFYVDSTGNIFLPGQFSDSADFDPGVNSAWKYSNGSADAFIAKYDSSGSFIWCASFGGSGTDLGYGVMTDQAGNIFTCGSFNDSVDFDPGIVVNTLVSHGLIDTYFLKLDPNGNLLWVETLGGGNDDLPLNIILDDSANIYLCGYYASDTIDFDPGPGVNNQIATAFSTGYFAKYDSNGNYIWAHSIDAALIFGESLTQNKKLLLSGQFTGSSDFDPGMQSAVLSSSGQTDVFFAEYDANGNYLFAKKIGGLQLENAYQTLADQNNGILISGHFSGTTDFNPDIPINNLTSSGAGDIFIAYYDSAGNYMWAEKMGGPGFDFCRNIIVNHQGELLLAGGFENTVDFDPGTGIDNLTSFGSRDAYFEKLGYSLVGIFPSPHSQNFLIYPNPFIDQLSIKTPLIPEDNLLSAKGEIKIVDIAGNEILTKQFNPVSKTNLNLSTGFLSAGIYFAELNFGKYSIRKKLIKL